MNKILAFIKNIKPQFWALLLVVLLFQTFCLSGYLYLSNKWVNERAEDRRNRVEVYLKTETDFQEQYGRILAVSRADAPDDDIETSEEDCLYWYYIVVTENNLEHLVRITSKTVNNATVFVHYSVL